MRRAVAALAFPCACACACAASCGDRSADVAPPQAASASVRDDDREFTVRVEPDRVAVGEPMTLTLSVIAGGSGEEDLDDAVAALRLGETLGVFRVRPLPERDRAEPGRASRAYHLLTFESGELEIPPIALRVGEGAIVETPALPVTVDSLIGDDDDPSRFAEIKGSVGPRRFRPHPIPALIAGAVLLGCGVAGIVIARRRKSAAPPPRERALAELGALESKDPRGGEGESIVAAAADVVRRYIGDRFALRAPERTTREFLELARTSQRISAPHQGLLATFLGHADLVKFAAARADAHAVAGALTAARRFVEETPDEPATRPAPQRESRR